MSKSAEEAILAIKATTEKFRKLREPFEEFECLVDAIKDLSAVAKANGIDLITVKVRKNLWREATPRCVDIMTSNGLVRIKAVTFGK